MTNRTMQDWADFMGLPVAKDQDGEVNIFWGIPHILCKAEWTCREKSLSITGLVSDAEKHDWEELVMPQHNYNKHDTYVVKGKYPFWKR